MVHFKQSAFKFQPYLYNDCHDLIMVSLNLSDIAISKIKNEIKAINLRQNIDSIEESVSL